MKINLVIDGIEVTTESQKTILEVSLNQGIYIPHLCYNPDLIPGGTCRLCVVEVEKRGIVPACETKVEDGMIVYTETEKIVNIRKMILELILAEHPNECIHCAKNTDCKLEKLTNYIGIDKERLLSLRKIPKTYPIDDTNPFFIRDMNKCILCGVCVRTCNDIVGTGAINFGFWGYQMKVSTFWDKPIIESNCESCGECMVRCPVGALIPKSMQKPAYKVKSICPYCGCGCGINIGVRGNKVVFIEGDRENPVNKGNLCVKGRFGYEFINHPQRLKSPLIKKNGKFEEISWDEALNIMADKLKKYRGDRFAFITSTKCTNEENFVFQKFSRLVMQTNNIDNSARLCHAPTVVGLAQTLGSSAMTNSIPQIKSTRAIFAIGTNTNTAHTIIAREMKQAKRNGAKLIIANPMRIDLCRFADIFLQFKPGTDVMLLSGMMRVIIDEELYDREFIDERTEGFLEFKASVKDIDLESVEKITGVSKKDVVEAAKMYATNKPGMIFYSMGITQHSHGTDNVFALSNLALLCGNLGKDASGINPLRGQNNVQGACDMGALPTVYPGYQRVDDKDIVEKFEKFWNSSLPKNKGLTLPEMFESDIAVFYIVGMNPVISHANAKIVEKSLSRAEFVIVQDIFLSETAEFADLVLPACSFAEKNGTFTNTERRVQLIKKAISPPPGVIPEYKIITMLANKMNVAGFDYKNEQEIFNEIRKVTPIYAGITYERLEKGGIQWPCTSEEDPGTETLYKDKFKTPSGRAKFIPIKYKPSAELPTEEYPFILTTYRLLEHFHTGTMTHRISGLRALKDKELLLISRDDAKELEVYDGDVVEVISRRGSIKTEIKVVDSLIRGVVAMTFHFPKTHTNLITNPALDSLAKIPETKVTAVKLRKIKNT